ncbi:hypothetical protein [Bradyrhizobium quebecense]|uniref:Pilus formation protein N-terminal domain-containing protein n=2 Tax=Bradyrhizobium quebecense TaxID=2748629 RepID=A0A973WNA9_9BRAD|nr:hypothetical protein [Bradyrhizobium quebecense]UGA47137.1 hypothetical protein HU230_0014270 [Bradyrhizobium quebecense]UGY03259.1 hypothetical protein J4P68_0000305 [Bradyrhizobium quebecense]
MRLLKSAMLLTVFALSCAGPTSAQDRDEKLPKGPPPRERLGPTTSADVLTQEVVPAPENGNIILKFRDTTQVYFKRQVSAVRLDDDLLVTAIPKSDHVIAFTGLAPGVSKVTIESKDGTNDTYGLVTIVREPHVVKIYQRGEINRVSGERRSDSSSAIGGYVSLNCNEIGCAELEPEVQPRLPK